MKNFLLTLLTAFLPLHAHAELQPVDQLRPGRYGSDEGLRCPIKIEPGHGIGGIRIGMHRAAVAMLGMKVRAVRGAPHAEIVGRYGVLYNEQDIVSGVELGLQDAPGCVQLNGKKIPKRATVAELAQMLPGCKKEEARIGGNFTICDKIAISRGAWGGPTIRVIPADWEARPFEAPGPLQKLLKKLAPAKT